MGFFKNIFSKNNGEDASSASEPQKENPAESSAARVFGAAADEGIGEGEAQQDGQSIQVGEGNQAEGGIAITGVTSDYLQFDSFQFKLAVIHELMYEQELLGEPYHGGDDFMEAHAFDYEDGTDEDYENLKQHRIAAKQYFEALEIPRVLAEEVEHLCVDQSNEIYYQIDPLHGDFDERDWEGRHYYISDITDRELLPFTNLKGITFNGFNAGGQELLTKLRTHSIDAQDSDM